MHDVPRGWTDLVPRCPFVPSVIWVRAPDGGWLVPLSRADDPDGWEAAVAADEAVITQVDDGAAGRGTWPTSSSSAPWLMNRMLDALDLWPGLRVLEIGTGTGWLAAIMAAAGASVVTVEISPDLAEHARCALAATDHHDALVITGDGEVGYPERAPYDRVIASAAVHTVPYPWVEQVAEGGRIVVPYTGDLHRGALVVLEVRGGVAEGYVAGEAPFMPLRGQRLSQDRLRAIGESHPDMRIVVTRDGQRVSARPGRART